MTKQETAMQKLDNFLENEEYNVFNVELMKFSIKLLSKLKELQETERIQIQDAFDDGQANWDEKCQDYKNGKGYFNNSFKKEI